MEPVFKPYEQDQPDLIPRTWIELIPEGHLVRFVNKVIEGFPLQELIASYPGGGASAYHPLMMLKIILYAYVNKIYTSRMIAKAVRENIHFIWLSGAKQPDFRTINRFRSSKLKGIIDTLFYELLKVLMREGKVTFDNYFLDGTKIESKANRYTFVWGKATAKFEARLDEEVKKLSKEIDRLEADENERFGESDLPEMSGSSDISAEDIKEIAERIKKILENKAHDKDETEVKKKLKKVETDYLPRKLKYAHHRKVLAGRNSYSKTDPDATFMRMKEDHMRNGQLKPAYNVQIGTENQFIVGYSIHQRPTDTGCLVPHLDRVQKLTGMIPRSVIADAGYGSEENYRYLEKKGIEAFVKYNTFHKESKRSYRKKHPYYSQFFKYDETTDTFLCPENKPLHYVKTVPYVSDNNSRSERRVYVANDCDSCPAKSECTNAAGNRSIHISLELMKFKERSRQLLNSERGKRLRSQRSVDVEPVFGNIKHNARFTRFYLKGLDKVRLEWGLLSMAHNLRKLIIGG